MCVCERVLERVGLLLSIDLYPGETSNCGEKRPPEAEDLAWRRGILHLQKCILIECEFERSKL